MLLAMETVRALGLPPPARGEQAGLREIGRGELRWLGFKLYDAALWARACLQNLHNISEHPSLRTKFPAVLPTLRSS